MEIKRKIGRMLVIAVTLISAVALAPPKEPSVTACAPGLCDDCHNTMTEIMRDGSCDSMRRAVAYCWNNCAPCAICIEFRDAYMATCRDSKK